MNGGDSLNVVLVEPEIPANTGNIARLCVATGSKLHLVRPLGFFLNDRRVRRAGLDYWEYLDLTVHDSWNDFRESVSEGQIYLVETGGNRLYTEVDFAPNDYVVFGSETKGLSSLIIKELADNIVSLPQMNVRSLNLSNTVSIVVYEAWRQLGFVDVKNLI